MIELQSRHCARVDDLDFSKGGTSSTVMGGTLIAKTATILARGLGCTNPHLALSWTTWAGPADDRRPDPICKSKRGRVDYFGCTNICALPLFPKPMASKVMVLSSPGFMALRILMVRVVAGFNQIVPS